MPADNRTHHTARSSWLRLYPHGLNVAVGGNAQAFGFSILITVNYGIVSASSGSPSTGELIGFALSAVAVFSSLNILVASLTETRSGDTETARVVLIATATDSLPECDDKPCPNARYNRP